VDYPVLLMYMCQIILLWMSISREPRKSRFGRISTWAFHQLWRIYSFIDQDGSSLPNLFLSALASYSKRAVSDGYSFNKGTHVFVVAICCCKNVYGNLHMVV
jgi:hypothetical protein